MERTKNKKIKKTGLGLDKLSSMCYIKAVITKEFGG
jgi:hypothetical protein